MLKGAPASMPARGSSELVRQRNSALVLAALRRHGPLSHTELADRTGLASATVSVITADLEKLGVIERPEAQAAAGRGRPRVLFRQKRDWGYLITVIISSDRVQFSLVDYAGRLIDRFEDGRSHDPSGAEAFAQAVRRGLERILERSRLSRERVQRISISSKGLVAADAPVLLWSPVFGDDRIDFSQTIGPDWAARVSLVNETLLVAEALAGLQDREQDGGAGEGPRALAALSLGHSIGLGIARRLADGSRELTAPNFGHMLHLPGGALCRCGSRGCIEAYAGFYAILRAAFEVPLDTVPAKFVPVAELDKIAARARQGHRMSGFAFRQAGLSIGNGLSRLLSLTERMPVVITGPGSRYGDLILPGLQEGLAQSHLVRREGMPEIRLVADEQSLVFEGHLSRALAAIDEEIAGLGLSGEA